jgi:hypothetical protein
MPLRQYFSWVGSILFVALFVADWCLPAPFHAPHPEIPSNEKVNLRIRSDHKWPDKVVFDTTRSQFTPVAGASPEPDVAASQRIDQAGRRSPLDAFAAMIPAALPSTGLARRQEGRHQFQTSDRSTFP